MQKCLQERGVLEERDAQDLQDFAQTAVEFQLLLREGHQHVHAHGNPDLRLDGVDRRPLECPDAKVLLEPLQEQLDLPAALVQLGEHDPSGTHGPILSSEGWKNHGQTGRASRNQERSPCNVTVALSSTCI
jgi:hypothetical protein